MTRDALIAEITALAARQTNGGKRFLLALAGPPAAGKSTLAQCLAEDLPQAKVVPMDGFHYDDAILIARGQRARKGAPETFDVAGFAHLLGRLRSEAEVAIPLFDRDLEISRNAADIVTADDRILIIEGNYLLLDRAPWDGLAPLFDMTVFLEVPEAELIRRLTARWHHHGKSESEARAWIEGNDLPNALTVLRQSRPADYVLKNL